MASFSLSFRQLPFKTNEFVLREWVQQTLTWWKHLIKGLHKDHFIMAAKTDEIYGKTRPT
jgi:hypothetical protein